MSEVNLLLKKLSTPDDAVKEWRQKYPTQATPQIIRAIYESFPGIYEAGRQDGYIQGQIEIQHQILRSLGLKK